MQILSNGMVRISNKQTGQIKDVDPSQLGQYGTTLPQAYLSLKNQSSPQSSTSPDTQITPPSPAPAQEEQPDWLSSIVSNVTKPFRTVGEGAVDIGRLGSAAINKVSGGKIGSKITGDEKPVFLNQNEVDETVKHPVKAAAKTAAGLASFAVPAGAGLKAAMGMGALSGGLYGASQDNATPESIALSALTGGVTGGVLKGTGQVYGGLSKMFSRGAAQNFAKATPTAIENAINEHGLDIATSIKNHIPPGASYDDVLGSAAQRGRGGIFGTKIAEAENKIQQGIANSGEEIVATKSQLINPLIEMRDKLAGGLGNGDKVKQLDEIIAEANKYNSGLTANKLLEIKRTADEAFGKAVVDDTHGAVNNQAQKLLGNSARGLLKGQFKDVADALDAESELYTLRPIISKARATELAANKIKPSNLVNLANPAKPLDAVFNNPKVASTLMGGAEEAAPSAVQAVGGGVRQQANDAVVNTAKSVGNKVVAPGAYSATREVGAMPGNALQSLFQTGVDEQGDNSNANNNGNVADNHMDQSISQNPIVSQATKTGQIPSQEALQREYFVQLQQGTPQGRGNATAIMQAMDKFYPNQTSKPLSSQQQLNKTNAESGLRALDTVESQLKTNNGVMLKNELPGIIGRAAGASTYRTARKEAADVLTRLRTGAALNKEEQDFYGSQLPEPGDSAKDITYKLQLFRDLFNQIANHQKGALPETAGAPLDAVYAQ